MLQAVRSLFRKKGLYTYLQYTQLLAKESDLQPFSKSLFCFCWFFQIRMNSSIKMRCRKRQLLSEDFSLGDSYCYQGELDIENVAPRNHLVFFLCCSPE